MMHARARALNSPAGPPGRLGGRASGVVASVAAEEGGPVAEEHAAADRACYRRPRRRRRRRRRRRELIFRRAAAHHRHAAPSLRAPFFRASIHISHFSHIEALCAVLSAWNPAVHTKTPSTA